MRTEKEIRNLKENLDEVKRDLEFVKRQLNEMDKKLKDIQYEHEEEKEIANEEKTYYFTDIEKEWLNMIDSKYNWIARDVDGELYLYENKPKIECCVWECQDGDLVCIDNYVTNNLKFDSIKREDKEPCEFRKFI